MARSISVKIPVSSLVQMIEEKIAEIDKAIASYPADLEKYEKDTEAYKKKVAKFISDYLAKNSNKVGYDFDSIIRISDNRYNSRFDLSFDPENIGDFPKRPEQPKKPNPTEHFGRDYTTRKELLEKNLKILRMTSQEEVSASTYGAVMEIL
jgi:hypothetical protein